MSPDRNTPASIAPRLGAAAIGFATALVLVFGIQARSGSADSAAPSLVSAPPPNTQFAPVAVTSEVELGLPPTSDAATMQSAAPTRQSMEPTGESTRMTAAAQPMDDSTPVPEVRVENASILVPESPEGPDCGPLAEELWRREDAGEFVEEPYVELSEAEYAAAPLELPVPRADMAAQGERPAFEDFGDGYEISSIPDDRLQWVVGYCWELGFLDN